VCHREIDTLQNRLYRFCHLKLDPSYQWRKLFVLYYLFSRDTIHPNRFPLSLISVTARSSKPEVTSASYEEASTALTIDKQAILDNPVRFIEAHGFPLKGHECIVYLFYTLGGLDVWTEDEILCVCEMSCQYYRELTVEEIAYRIARNDAWSVDRPILVEIHSPFIALYGVTAILGCFGKNFVFSGFIHSYFCAQGISWSSWSLSSSGVRRKRRICWWQTSRCQIS
jgi:hypothetical protein